MARDDDTNQTNVHLCTRSIQVYIRLTHLVGESTAVRSRKDYLTEVRRTALNSCA